MKMGSLIAVLFVAACTTAPVAGQLDESLLPNSELAEYLKTTTSKTLPSTSTASADSLDSVISKKKLELMKFGFYDKSKADRGLKPFTFGKKFELQNQFNVDLYERDGDSKRESLNSQLIKKPIRMLPFYSTGISEQENDDSESGRNFFDESKEEKLAEELEGDKETVKKLLKEQVPKNFEDKWNPRQEADRSLMVVLPLNPSDNGNVEELFTKKPLVRMLGTENFNEKSEDIKDSTIFPILKENDATATTKLDRKSFLTRKPWRPSKRVRFTTETYISTTETAEDFTKTYTNYNDVEQVTQKFQVETKTNSSNNHKYDVENVTSHSESHLRNQMAKFNFGEGAIPSTIRIHPFGLAEGKHNSRRKVQRKFPTTENPSKVGGLKKVLEILPADLKDVMLNLELNKEKDEDITETKTILNQKQPNIFDLKKFEAPSIDAKSYAIFKPIPLEVKNDSAKGVSEDVKKLLASFGLLPLRQRQQKSLNPERRRSGNEIFETNLNFLPENMKSVLKEMGLLKFGDARQSSSIHIFNPSNYSSVRSDEDFKKLKAILSSINATGMEFKPKMPVETFQKENETNYSGIYGSNVKDINDGTRIVSNKIQGSLTTRQTKRATKLADGPNPLVYAEENLLKNDVKRQKEGSNDSNDTTTSTSSTSPLASDREDKEEVTTLEDESSSESVTTTTTTEESPNLEALKESFGGGETASDSADVDSSLPPRRPNGLYLLLDWNSFFEVGTEDDSRRVNLRFQPKIGNARNFLPVSIP